MHTSYALASTTTGRLSSNDPNLQNIPVRTEEGRKIRRAFIAEPGHVLISADYSQIELRLVAHIGDIPQLKRAFREGLDIHAMTASGDVRGAGRGHAVRRCGAGPRRSTSASSTGSRPLASPTSCRSAQGEAGAYIETYFERFPGIRAYMDSMRAQVREHGYVTTIFGRKISIPAIQGPSR